MALAASHNPAQKPRVTVPLPAGISVREAQFLLETLFRLKV